MRVCFCFFFSFSVEVCSVITALPGLLISGASVAQCGTSSPRCLLLPPPSSEITVSNLFGT